MSRWLKNKQERSNNFKFYKRSALSPPAVNYRLVLLGLLTTHRPTLSPVEAPSTGRLHHHSTEKPRVWSSTRNICSTVSDLVWNKEVATPRNAMSLDTPWGGRGGKEGDRRTLLFSCSAKPTASRRQSHVSFNFLNLP